MYVYLFIFYEEKDFAVGACGTEMILKRDRLIFTDDSVQTVFFLFAFYHPSTI